MFPFTQTIADYTAEFPAEVFTPHNVKNRHPDGEELEETGTVPATADAEGRYRLNLDQVPLEQLGMTVTVDGNNRDKVPYGLAPAAGQVAINMVNGLIEFHESDADLPVIVNYFGKGTPIVAYLFHQLGKELLAAQTRINELDGLPGSIESIARQSISSPVSDTNPITYNDETGVFNHDASKARVALVGAGNFLPWIAAVDASDFGIPVFDDTSPTRRLKKGYDATIAIDSGSTDGMLPTAKGVFDYVKDASGGVGSTVVTWRYWRGIAALPDVPANWYYSASSNGRVFTENSTLQNAWIPLDLPPGTVISGIRLRSETLGGGSLGSGEGIANAQLHRAGWEGGSLSTVGTEVATSILSFSSSASATEEFTPHTIEEGYTYMIRVRARRVAPSAGNLYSGVAAVGLKFNKSKL